MADESKRKIGAGSFDPSKTRFHGSELLDARRVKSAPPPLPPRERPDWQSKTRLLPIELLVPQRSRRPPAASRDQTCKLGAPALPPRRWLTKQRVYAWSACIVLWVTVAAASGAPSPEALGFTRAPGAVDQAVTIRTRVPVSERSPRAAANAPPDTVAGGPPLERAAAPRADSASAQDPGRPRDAAVRARPAGERAAATPDARAATQPMAARVTQRAAVEALAAGDTLAAAQFYAALARQQPDNPAFARAARILTQLRKPHDPSEGGTP